MINPWSRFVALMDRREGGEALAAIRLALGAAALIAVSYNVPVWQDVWLDIEHGGYRNFSNPPWLVAALGGTTPTVIGGLLATTAVSGALIFCGVLPQLAALVYLQTHLALTDINGHAGGSYDQVLSNALWLLVFMRSGATWSVSCRLRTGRWSNSEARVPSWPRYLMVLQLVLIYCSTGLQKVSSHWLPGGDLGALYYILQQPSWARWPDMTWLAWVFPVTQVMTLSVWLFEVSSPVVLLALWARSSRTSAGPLRRLLCRLRVRDLFALFGVGMHIGIHTLMSVGPFSIVSLAMYPALWHADEWHRLSRRWSAWRGRPATPSRSKTPAPRAG
ncbi:MAG: hypothetical protein ACI8S6_002516 [Myxococcota bacterium]|jgi:hypothetical protein